MLDQIFGTELPLAARFFIAFLVVLGLIGLTAWLVRRFGASRLGSGSARGRQPRLAVIDAASVDGRRRLVLIRRDNVEHLLMIGGPSDLVVEPNIVRAVGAREVSREPARVSGEASPRATPAVETSWPLQPSSEPSSRPYRASVTDEPWLATEPGARARPATESLTGLHTEFPAKGNPPEAPAIRPEPIRMAPSEPSASPQTDHNLAEMALQLEAALRRAPDGRPPVTDPLAVQPMTPAAKTAEPPRAIREFKSRTEPRVEPKIEPKVDTKFETKFEPKTEPKIEPRTESKPDQAPAKSAFDSLEQEMASLLGRPSGKT